MQISMKMVKNLTVTETFFIYAMIESYKKTKNKNTQSTKNKRKKNAMIHNHENCKPDNPCLFDFKCPAWEKCTDEKFIQYRLIMQKCEFKND